MVPLLKPLQMKAGEVLWKEKEPPSEVYFVKKGKVSFLLENAAFQHMVVGSYFGEIDVLFNIPRSYFAVANNEFSETELLSLERTKFIDILDAYPEIA